MIAEPKIEALHELTSEERHWKEAKEYLIENLNEIYPDLARIAREVADEIRKQYPGSKVLCGNEWV